MVETFWSAGTPSRTRLRRTKKTVHFPSAPPPARTVLCFAGQPVLLPQQVHQRCVPSLMVMKMMTRKLFHLPQQYPRQCFFVFALCCMLLFVSVDCCYCILVFPDQPTRLRRSVRRLLRIKWQPPTLVTTQQRPQLS